MMTTSARQKRLIEAAKLPILYHNSGGLSNHQGNQPKLITLMIFFLRWRADAADESRQAATQSTSEPQHHRTR